MAKKMQPAHGLEFGSDSFLDVLTNMVGILIILIVIAGLRIKHSATQLPVAAPNVPSSSPTSEYPTASDLLAQQQWMEQHRQREIVLAVNEARWTAWESALAKLADWESQQQLVAQRLEDNRQAMSRYQQQLEDQRQQQAVANQRRQSEWQSQHDALSQARQQRQRDEHEQTELAKQVDTARTSLAQASAKYQEHQDQLKMAELTQAEQAKKANQLQQRLAELRRRWDQGQKSLDQKRKSQQEFAAQSKLLQDKSTPDQVTRQWVHLGSPLAAVVERGEVHFRCLDQQVAYVPMSELIDQLKHELSNLGRQVADPYLIVGPVAGFRLQYQLERATRDVADRRTVVSEIQLLPEPALAGETAAMALAEQSAFARRLADHSPESFAVTIWVYPDSFMVAKQLQLALHERGYQVALRPLQHGNLIGASRYGSRSMAQ